MKFTIYQDSRIGKRKSNQDRMAYCYSRDALLMVIADGMGGHLYGEVAAQICVQYITQAFQRDARPSLRDPFLFLSQALTNAHHAILDYTEEKKLSDAPRTTCVVCVIQDNVACWAHAGDSRLYHLRGGRILTHTRDHSRVQMLVDQGLISPEDAAAHPGRNRIFSCLGGPHSPQIEFSRRTPLHAGDILTVCTDGVWGMLENIDLVRFLTAPDLGQGVVRLMQKAEMAGGAQCDNLSLIALRWEDNYADAGNASVSTKTMPVDHFTTRMGNFTRTPAAEALPDLSDEEIEKAIREINSAIQKFTR